MTPVSVDISKRLFSSRLSWRCELLHASSIHQTESVIIFSPEKAQTCDTHLVACVDEVFRVLKIAHLPVDASFFRSFDDGQGRHSCCFVDNG